ncbi:MAG: GNAT family N-acetyltransferase [Candidatus Nomurabacteria bacterium]|jgi:ribosomal protein S18 acetylase RimI-like enzyme|nr:GNAT family N-acetyltransferase [Candidatus Nomurabacteria bacterium]
MNDFKIREATIDDLKMVQDLNYKLFVSDSSSDPLLNLDWPYEEGGEKYFRSAILDDDRCCFVAEVKGKVVGYLAGVLRVRTICRKVVQAELDNTLVEQEYRSKGIGKKLAEEFFAWSKRKNAQKIFVSAYAKNERAVSFYKSVGFEPYSVGLEKDCE